MAIQLCAEKKKSLSLTYHTASPSVIADNQVQAPTQEQRIIQQY